MNQFKLKVKKHFTNYNWKIKAKIITVAVIVFLIVFDQLMKLLASQKLELDREVLFMPRFINLLYTINHGSAFGLNQGKTILLMSFAFVVAFILLIWWVFSRTTSHMVAISFLIAGTLGNLIDRFLHEGGVIDFLKWDMFNPKTIFNTADIMVTIGIIILVLAFVISWIKNLVYDRKELTQQKNKVVEQTNINNKENYKETKSLENGITRANEPTSKTKTNSKRK